PTSSLGTRAPVAGDPEPPRDARARSTCTCIRRAVVEEGGMAFAWPLALNEFGARARTLRSGRTWLRAVLPAALVCAGALLLSPRWRGGPQKPAAAPRAAAPDAPLLPAAGDPLTLVGALLVVGGALALLPSLLARLQARARGGGQIELVEVRPLGGR